MCRDVSGFFSAPPRLCSGSLSKADLQGRPTRLRPPLAPLRLAVPVQAQAAAAASPTSPRSALPGSLWSPVHSKTRAPPHRRQSKGALLFIVGLVQFSKSDLKGDPPGLSASPRPGAASLPAAGGSSSSSAHKILKPIPSPHIGIGLICAGMCEDFSLFSKLHRLG